MHDKIILRIFAHGFILNRIMWNIGFKDVLDILIVAWGMYYLYRNSQKSGTLVLFQGILAVFIAWLVVSQVFQMKLLGSIFDSLISVGLIALVVLFQNDIRRMLMEVGSRRRWTSLMRVFGENPADLQSKEWVDPLVMACRDMCKNQVGALICIEGHNSLQQYAETGEIIDARISSRMVQQIFFKNSPLHDGAMIIRNGRILAAACILPVSHDMTIPKEYGLRHRSGIGLTEQRDAMVIVVSEETGKMMVIVNNHVLHEVTTNMLQRILLTRFSLKEQKPKK